jgi:hypothetical protein
MMTVPMARRALTENAWILVIADRMLNALWKVIAQSVDVLLDLLETL